MSQNIFGRNSQLTQLGVKHSPFHHRAGPAKFGNLMQRLHTEEVDFQLLKEQEAGLFGVGLPVPLKRQFELQQCHRLLVLERRHRAEACQPAQFRNLTQRLHTEEVDFPPLMKNQEAELLGIGLPVPLK